VTVSCDFHVGKNLMNRAKWRGVSASTWKLWRYRRSGLEIRR